MPMEVVGSGVSKTRSGMHLIRTESRIIGGGRDTGTRRHGGWERMPTVYSQSGLRAYWREQQQKRSAQTRSVERTAHQWIEPPYPLDTLTNLFLENIDYYSVVDQLAIDVAGYGWELVDRYEKQPGQGDVDVTANADAAAVAQRKQAEEWLRSLPEDIHRQPISLADLFKAVMIDFGATGNAAIEVSRGQDGKPDGLYHLPSRFARVLKNGLGWVQVDEQGKDVSIFRHWRSDPTDPDNLVSNRDARQYKPYKGRAGQPRNELKVWKSYNPNEERYGVPPVVAALVQLFGNIYSRHRNLRFFINRAMPEWLVQVEAESTDWQDPELASQIQSSIDELQEHLQMLVEGDDYRMVIQKVPSDRAKFTWQEISTSLDYNDVQGYELDNRDSVIRAYRVPPHRLGIIETASLGSGTGESQGETYKRGRVDPNQGMLEEFVNELMWEKGFDLLRFKFNELDTLDEQREMGILSQAVVTKAISVNEIRSWLSRIVKDQDFPAWQEDEEADIPIYILEAVRGGAIPGSVGGFGFPQQMSDGRMETRGEDREMQGVLRRLSDGLRDRMSDNRRRFGVGGNGETFAAAAPAAPTSDY